MSLLSLLRRLIVLCVTLSVPFAAVGAALDGRRGAIAGGLLLLALLTLAYLAAEPGIRRIYRVHREPPEGVSRSLERVLAVLGGPAPRVLTISDPAPLALVARGPWSNGAILLTEGLLGALTEEELRELLALAVRRLRGRGIGFQTFCAFVAHQAFELAPRSWVQLLFGELRWHDELGALSALRFAMVFAGARFFVQLGRTPRTNAPHGLDRLPLILGEVGNPGSSILHFSAPWSPRALLLF